jgi:hypothetical protein
MDRMFYQFELSCMYYMLSHIKKEKKRIWNFYSGLLYNLSDKFLRFSKGH